MHLDTTDPAALEAALEAQPPGTVAHVRLRGEVLTIRRVDGGWYLPGDLVITSGDVADGRPDAVEVVRP
jgi:hypothetical protein